MNIINQWLLLKSAMGTISIIISNIQHRIILFILPGLIFLLIVCCDMGVDRSDRIHAIISGTVSDAIDSTIINSAWVDIDDSLAPYYTATDSAGNYVIGLIGGYEATDMVIYFGSTGYVTLDTEVVIPAGQNLDITINVLLLSE